MQNITSTAQQLFLQELKQATLASHEAVERNAYSTQLMQADLTPAQYLRILQRFYGFVQPVEAMFYPLLATALPNPDRFKRTELLQADLRTLGMSDAAIGDLPILPDLPVGKDLADVFGVTYVLEGSKLGGQFISRHVGQALGLSPENGLRFFNGHGRQAGAFWNEFRQTMADFAVHAGQETALITAAINTFNGFNTWLKN